MRVITKGPAKITKATIDAVWPQRADGQRLIVRDKDCRGLALVVNPTGMRWEFAYRPRGTHPETGKRWPNRSLTLGTPDSLSPDAARGEAGRLKGETKAGRDPMATRRATAAARRAAEAQAEARAVDLRFTFGKLVDAWEKGREGDRRASYLREAVACLKRNLPDWQGRPASDITLRDAVRALDALKADKGVVTANRTLAYGRAAFSWAVKRQLLASNPLRGIERPGRETTRERVLTTAEVGAIWRACDALGELRAAFVRTLMLTLQRREEVVSMPWAELSADLTTWTLPAEQAKNRKTHIIHLAKPAQAILAALPRDGGAGRVFAGESRGGTIGAFSSMKATIETALAEAGHQLPEWRFHDFRRSGVTALAGMGFAPHVCDRLLNHITGTIQGVAAVYQRAEFLPERKAALEAWAAFVLRGAEGKHEMSNVAELRRKTAA